MKSSVDPTATAEERTSTGDTPTPTRNTPTPNRAHDPFKPLQSRTVNDFDTNEDLRMALVNMNIRNREDCDDAREGAESDCGSGAGDVNDDMDSRSGDSLDWTLANYDVENSCPNPNSISKEVERLQNLKSFQMLDRDKNSPKAALDRISAMATRLFQVPICSINIMDMGRAWSISAQGIGDIRESSRKESWCNHTIRYKADLMVVADATKDWRFCHSPHVTGPFQLRFYAGAPLVSPEGYRLGEICVMGCQARPNGLSEEEKATLVDLASLVSSALAERRELNRQKKLLETTSGDMMAPIQSVKHCLKVLGKECGNRQQAKLKTALVSAHVLANICRSSSASQESDPSPKSKDTSKTPGKLASPEGLASTRKELNLRDCIHQLHAMIDPLPKQVPVVIAVDMQVPPMIVANKLDILRASLHLLCNACTTSTRGQIQFQIVRNRTGKKDELIFECHDSRSLTPETSGESQKEQGRHDCLFSTMDVSSHGIDWGGKDSHRIHWTPRHLQSIDTHTRIMTKQGTYVWFSIPLVEPVLHARNDPHSTPISKGAGREPAESRTTVEEKTLLPFQQRETASTRCSPQINGEALGSNNIAHPPAPSNASILRSRDRDELESEVAREDGGLQIEANALDANHIRKRLKLSHQLVALPNISIASWQPK